MMDLTATLQDTDDFAPIGYKLKAIESFDYFTDPISQTMFGEKYSSPICFGPLDGCKEDRAKAARELN